MTDASLDRAGAVDFVSYLPDRVWYLTASGQEMWCRRPYTFFFTSSEAAERFVQELGSEFPLVPIGVNSRTLVSDEALAAMRNLHVTRIFLDPRRDPTTGDVFGTILRLDAAQ